MKMRNKFLLVLAALICSGPAHAQLAGTQRLNEHIWLPGDRCLKLGATPNATACYTGGNLVLDVISGGGHVVIPDGIDLSTTNLSLASSLVFEGSTADAVETTLTVVDPTSSDKTVTVPNQTGAVILSAGGVVDSASAISGGTGTFVFEGATADAFETTVGVVDPTADQTWSVPNFAVSAAFLGSTLTTNNVDAANSVWGVSNSLTFEGATADAFEIVLTPADASASDKTITLPNLTGTVLVDASIDTSAELIAVLGDETGTGAAVFGTSPTLTTPNIGAATGTSLSVSSFLRSTSATDAGWSVVAGADTACNTTCTNACGFGQNTGDMAIVDCANATADVCVCLGAN